MLINPVQRPTVAVQNDRPAMRWKLAPVQKQSRAQVPDRKRKLQSIVPSHRDENIGKRRWYRACCATSCQSLLCLLCRTDFPVCPFRI